MLWNQLHIECPATASQKLDLTKQSQNNRNVMTSFLKSLPEHVKGVQDSIQLINSEVDLLKRFLYKLAAVFAHDQSYKVLKQIQKTANRLKEANLLATLMDFQGQHTTTMTAEKYIYVAPSPKYQYLLLRMQGAARLCAQMLLYCQRLGRLLIQKLQLGHFVNIIVISMSFAARLWAMSLHLMGLAIHLYNEVVGVYNTSGLLPLSTVEWLPTNYELPMKLEEWLKNDTSLAGIQKLIVTSNKTMPTNDVKDIWQNISISEDDENEKAHLLQLKDLVTGASFASPTEVVNTPVVAHQISSGMKIHSNCDIDLGELVLREKISGINKKNKRKRIKKQKGNHLGN